MRVVWTPCGSSLQTATCHITPTSTDITSLLSGWAVGGQAETDQGDSGWYEGDHASELLLRTQDDSASSPFLRQSGRRLPQYGRLSLSFFRNGVDLHSSPD